MASNVVTRRRTPRMANVKMPGEKNVGAAFCQSSHRHFCAPNQIAIVMGAWQIEWMVCHQNLRGFIRQGAKLFLDASKLLLINPAAFYHQRARRADADHDHFIIGIHRLKIVGDVPSILVQRTKESVVNVVKRDVVIAGHHDFRLRQRIEELTGFLKLMRTCALREITGNCDERGIQFPNCSEKWCDQRGIRPAKM